MVWKLIGLTLKNLSEKRESDQSFQGAKRNISHQMIYDINVIRIDKALLYYIQEMKALLSIYML